MGGKERRDTETEELQWNIFRGRGVSPRRRRRRRRKEKRHFSNPDKFREYTRACIHSAQPRTSCSFEAFGFAPWPRQLCLILPCEWRKNGRVDGSTKRDLKRCICESMEHPINFWRKICARDPYSFSRKHDEDRQRTNNPKYDNCLTVRERT